MRVFNLSVKEDESYVAGKHFVHNCCQDQTPFMRKNRLQAHVGGTIVRFHQAKTGEINRFQVEFFPFYDKGFYEGKDKFRKW
jgi:hypothetical protein